MSARVFRISLPMPSNRGNARQHWRASLRDKKSYFANCDQLQLLGTIEAPPALPLSRVVLTATMYLGNPMDDDNAASRLKWPLDWLKTRGYIVDDSRKHLQWSGFPRQVIERKAPPHVELALAELVAADRR